MVDAFPGWMRNVENFSGTTPQDTSAACNNPHAPSPEVPKLFGNGNRLRTDVRNELLAQLPSIAPLACVTAKVTASSWWRRRDSASPNDAMMSSIGQATSTVRPCWSWNSGLLMTTSQFN